MTRRNAGCLLFAIGCLLIVAGAVGLLTNPPAPSAQPSVPSQTQPTAISQTQPTAASREQPSATPQHSPSDVPSPNRPSAVPNPDQPFIANAFEGSYDDPARTAFDLAHPETAATEVPSFHQVARLAVSSTASIKDGTPADALLLELPAVPDREFTVIVLVEADRPPVPDTPDNLYGLQWLLSYSDKTFTKSARRVGADGLTEEPSDHFSTRFEGLGDRAEIEFYGPPGTRYQAVLLTDGAIGTLIIP